MRYLRAPIQPHDVVLVLIAAGLHLNQIDHDSDRVGGRCTELIGMYIDSLSCTTHLIAELTSAVPRTNVATASPSRNAPQAWTAGGRLRYGLRGEGTSDMRFAKLDARVRGHLAVIQILPIGDIFEPYVLASALLSGRPREER